MPTFSLEPEGLGPLSSFSAKIRLGYLLKLYAYLVRCELTAIKGIRNRFAHEQSPITFDTPNIVTLVEKLKLIKNHVQNQSRVKEISRSAQSVVAAPLALSWEERLLERSFSDAVFSQGSPRAVRVSCHVQ
jgi:hypothetical protein